jgi:addiction module HigA family antidote
MWTWWITTDEGEGDIMPMKKPVHPGRIVKGSMTELGLSVTDASRVLGVTRPTISKLVNGRASISPEMAIRLSKAFGSTPEFWLKLQLSYDLAQIEARVGEIKIERYRPPNADLSNSEEDKHSSIYTN